MHGFEMCKECAGEYRDPADRRFHAQPVACPGCGPRLWFEGAKGFVEGTDAALEAAQAALAGGGIVAIKGLGGYHLACDATSDSAVETLRRRKCRPGKPFAVMVADLAGAGALGELSDQERALLSQPSRPIVLLRRQAQARCSPLVVPRNPDIGILLPYTPLHHLLFMPVPGSSVRVPGPLVMTSGNLSEEPICYRDVDARARLGGIADAWLVHDRPIHVPCDDSVVRFTGRDELPIRRSRGYAPLPIRLPFSVAPALATGGELKNTFCLASGRDAWMSQHIGDMGSVETLEAFGRSVGQFSEIYGIEPSNFLADTHPRYQTRSWIDMRGVAEPSLVQHHHAHVASVMAENGVAEDEAVIGFAFDGTGYGPDGAIWGGEVLVAGYGSAERVAHLRYVPLPGGDSAVRKPYRVALSHLRDAGVPWSGDLEPVRVAGQTELRALDRQLARGVQCVSTSSMGRLFDAVSSLIGICHVASYEAEAAIELEAAARCVLVPTARYRLSLAGSDIDPRPAVRAMVSDMRDGVAPAEIAAAFHSAVADAMVEVAVRQRARTGISVAALSGGVFQNVLLLELARSRLEALGLTVLIHRKVPPNDAGLALGQLAVAGRLR